MVVGKIGAFSSAKNGSTEKQISGGKLDSCQLCESRY